MSISTYRKKVQGLEKEIADIEIKIGKEQVKMERDSKALQRTKNSTVYSNKQRSLSNAQKRKGQLQKSKASQMKLLNNAVEQLNRLDTREDKKKQVAELKHTKSLTDEYKKQKELSSEISGQPIKINFEKLPAKINVLFLASNPSDQNPLRLDKEIRLIREKIQASEYRDSINLESRWAVRPDDLLREINDVQPHIIHFTGHGSDNHDIVLETTEGNTKLLSKEVVTQLIKTMSDSMRLVVFSNCFSSGQAEAVTEHIDCAIGMNEAVYEDAAMEFAAQFYSAIAFGKSVRAAYEQGKLAMILAGKEGNEIPELFTRKDLDPEKLIMVNPSA